MGLWMTVPFTHSPVSSFLLFFCYFVSPPTLIFTLFPLHMRVYSHCLSFAFFLSPSATIEILLIFFLASFSSVFMGPKYSFLLFCLQVGNKLSDIIAQSILILTKFMLHKTIWLLVDLSKVTSSRRHFLVFDKIQWKGKVNLLNNGYDRSTAVPVQGLVEGKSVWLELEHLQHWSALFLLLCIH